MDQVCDAMMGAIRALPGPLGVRPAQQRYDDRERVMDRRVFYDEPQIVEFIGSLEEKSAAYLKAAAERERAHLPIFPAQFRTMDLQGELWLFAR